MVTTTDMTLSIVIVMSNTRELLRNCLKSIYENTTGIEYEVIVVDNNSTDGSAEMVEEQFPAVKLIRNSENLGFSKGNNQGFAASAGRYMLALNSDTMVLNHAISAMVHFMDERSDAGACGCKLLNEDGSLQPSWENFPTILSEIFYGTPLSRIFPHRKRRPFSQGVYEVDWVSGACLMVRRETIEQVGGFDERFTPAYSEETDWCYRIKQDGWKVYYLAQPEVVHISGQTTKQKPTRFAVQLQRSKYLFFRKHRRLPYAWLYRVLKGTACLAKLTARCLSFIFVKRARHKTIQVINEQWQVFLFLLRPGAPIPQQEE